ALEGSSGTSSTLACASSPPATSSPAAVSSGRRGARGMDSSTSVRTRRKTSLARRGGARAASEPVRRACHRARDRGVARLARHTRRMASSGLVRPARLPGSFDPFTLGHLDLVRRALAVFGRVTIGVAHNSEKRTLFDARERVELAREATRGLDGALDVVL